MSVQQVVPHANWQGMVTRMWYGERLGYGRQHQVGVDERRQVHEGSATGEVALKR
jgi:hypothetical protein